MSTEEENPDERNRSTEEDNRATEVENRATGVANPATDGDNPLAGRMAVLLKHAREALAERTGPALAPYGIDGRSLAVLTVLAAGAPPSQQEAAARLGVDRTTMVGLIDGLEGKGLVVRAPHSADRRKNAVHLTPSGREVLDRAGRASEEAERRFLAPLSRAEADTLRSLLRALIAGKPAAAERARRAAPVPGRRRSSTP